MWKIELIIDNKSTSVDFVACSREELIDYVIPKLSKWCKLLNKRNKIINGTDNSAYFRITSFVYTSYPVYLDTILNRITDDINYYNSIVTSRNRIIKVSNRVNNRPKDEGLLLHIEMKDYINPFNDDVNYKINTDDIIVK